MPGNTRSDHHSRLRRRTCLRQVGLQAAALACLALAVACSGGSPNSSTGAGASGASGSTGPLAYSRCMRAHGIKAFPDPNSQGGLSLNAGPGTGIDPQSPQYQAADQTCKSLMPAQSPLSAAQQAAIKAGNLRYAQCMRTHGISDFPDPNSQGLLQIRAQPGSDLDPNNPRYQSANTACQHFELGGGKGGSLSTSGGGK
ncbi:MAG TPA: hypothetical protein VF482_16770 [Trebonia sp.]